MKKLGLLPKLILGIILGSLYGLLVNGISSSGGVHGFLYAIVRVFATFNGIFGGFLSFLIPLVIVSLVAVGLADLGKKANKLFGITLLMAYVSSITAGFLAYIVGATVLPGLLKNVTLADSTGEAVAPIFTIQMAPVFGVMTALILAFVLGLGLANHKEKFLLNVLTDFKDIITKVLAKVIIPLIPFHIAGLFMRIAVEGELLKTIKLFALLFVIILIIQVIYIIVQFSIAIFYTKKSFAQAIKNILPAYFTALGTQSSAATIPVSVECAYKNDIDKEIADFAVPLCATIHLAGDTITLVLGAIGIMLISGMEVNLVTFVPYILMLGVTMVAAPGIPGGGVMAALGLLGDMLLFTPGMKDLMITLHFAQDSFGTATNVSGDQALALIINKYSKDNDQKLTQ